MNAGKEIFATRGEAEKALRNMQKRKKGKGSVYFCKCCQGYHLTHFSYRYGKNLKTMMSRIEHTESRDNGRDNSRDNRDNVLSIVPRKRRKNGTRDNNERNIVPAIVQGSKNCKSKK